MSSLLITGGSGFIGSHLVDACIERGYDVTVVDVAPPHPVWGNTHARYVQRDIRDQDLVDVFIATKPEYVVHLAAHIDDRASVIHPVENAEHNILGTINVLDSARVAGVKRLIFASTGVVYGVQTRIPTSEEASARPLTPYAVSKLTGERYLRYFTSQLGLSTCALRLANVYGSRQDGSKECGAIAIFTKKIFQGESPFLNGTGDTTRDYVYVDDVVDAFMRALTVSEEGVCNIGTGIETSTRDLFTKVTHALHSTVSPIPRPEVQDLVRRVALDCSRAREVLGWQPHVGLDAGIAKTVAWYQDSFPHV